MSSPPSDELSDASPSGTVFSPVERRHPVLRAIMFAGGIVLILLGFALGFVPLLPGFPLGLLGIALLAASSRRVQTLLRRSAQRLPASWRTRVRAKLRRRRGKVHT